MESSYNASKEDNMSNQHNDCDYNKVSGFFSDKGKRSIIDDNNDFIRYDPKTDSNDICYHIDGMWKGKAVMNVQKTLPAIFDRDNDR